MTLPTRAEYDAATPQTQGYMAYTFSCWPGSDIPGEEECPYEKGTPEYEEFKLGCRLAVQAAQDSEE